MGKKMTLAQFSRELKEHRPIELVYKSEAQPSYRATDPVVSEIHIEEVRIWPPSGIIEMLFCGGEITLHRVREVELVKRDRSSGRVFDVCCASGVGTSERRIIRLYEPGV